MQSIGDSAEAVQAGFQILDDLGRQIVRLRQIVQIGQALVLEPENIQAGLVAGQNLLDVEFSPAPFRVFDFVPIFPSTATIGMSRISGCR